MNTPLWLWLCLSWHMPVYVTAVLLLTVAVVWAVLRLCPNVPNRGAWFRQGLRAACPGALIAQVIGFVSMSLILMEGDVDLAISLRQTAYGSFSVFRVPLCCFAVSFLVLYGFCRYVGYRNLPTDSLTRNVAAVVTALIASPWVILLPICL